MPQSDETLDETDGRADTFIAHLQGAAASFMALENPAKRESLAEVEGEIRPLEGELKSFAVIDRFTSFKILDVYNAIKTARLKIDFKMKRLGAAATGAADFAETAERFRRILSSCFSTIEDLYYYEIFGFFSTVVHPRQMPAYNLPCTVRTACAPSGFEKEPVLDENGSARLVDVVRFENRRFPDRASEWLCMTIGDRPELLDHERAKCALSEGQLAAIKSFVAKNKDLIYAHIEGDLDSPEFLDAVKGRCKN